MKAINLNMASVEVKAETRTIKSNWSRELVTDISQFTGIDNDVFIRILEKEIRRDSRKKSINKIFQN